MHFLSTTFKTRPGRCQRVTDTTRDAKGTCVEPTKKTDFLFASTAAALSRHIPVLIQLQWLRQNSLLTSARTPVKKSNTTYVEKKE